MSAGLPTIVHSRFVRFVASALFALGGLCVVNAQRVDSDRFARVPASLQPFVEQAEVSGVVALVADKDRVLHLSAVGESDLERGRKMRPDDLFWIASMTKPIAAVCVGILFDDGRLKFDDPVEKYLSEFKNPWVIEEQSAERRVLVKAARPITLHDLLTHTSGMGEYGATGPRWTLAEMIRAVAREPLKFQPGAKWGYSTAGIDVLCRVVEVVSGTPFAEFMQARLFGPLGMKDTTWWISTEQEPRFARNYRKNAQTGRLAETTIHYMYGGAVTDRARPPLGGAGLFSTAEDVTRFYQMMLRGGEQGGRQILKRETAAKMTQKQSGSLGSRPGMPWGYGFAVIEDPKGVEANAGFTPGSFGHGGAHGTQSWADPGRGLIFVMMIQRAGMSGGDNSAMRRAFQNAADQALATTPVR
jgi:CubicO group peptidase (beta-lactamase class C family)